ncbi:MAG TPA: LysR substrate-binding domain-containing protein [Fodinibius sp.]|nr:LysR substrate-binding domain-containing protein [Fodinibius sp.]
MNKKVLKLYNITPENIIYVQLTGAALEMVRANLGITVMPYWMASNYNYVERNELTCLPLTKNGLFRKWKIATLNAQHAPSYIQHFTQLLKAKQKTFFETS